jgi:tetratricopeptide (TPR) repeat protein
MPRDRHPAARKTLAQVSWAVGGLLLAIGGGAVWSLRTPAATESPSAMPKARSALAAGDFDLAERLATSVPATSADWPDAASIAGEAAAKAGRVDDAVRHYLALARRQQQSRTAPVGLYFAAETCRSVGRLTDAEAYYRKFLSHAPDNAAAHERLAFLLSTTGQRWESLPHYLALIRSGTATVPELTVFADLDRAVEQRPFLEECVRQSPDDPLVQLGLAADDFWTGNTAEAESRLRSLLAVAPHLVAGQALLGELLVIRSDQEFLAWYDRLPAMATDHPDLWYIRGLWARRHNQQQAAARCFWEAVRIAPTHRRATYQLGQTLRSLGEPGGTEFEERAQQLIQLTQMLDEVLRAESRHHEPYQWTAELLEQTGRIWEACAWGLVARAQFPQATWPQAVLNRWGERLTIDLPIVLPEHNLALKFDLSRFSPTPAGLDRLRHSPDRTDTAAPVAIRFAEAEQGPDFVYFNGADPLREEIVDPDEQRRADSARVEVRIRTRNRTRIFEQNGGGVAVIDFDLDGWPDLFFPQGAVWKHGDDGPTLDDVLTDRLYWNRRGQSFADVAHATGIASRGYGQGCSVGDIDNDGFPDLYVANVGRNQLYRNNGDGTFSDVTDTADVPGEDWTASCVIVDLNADGLPDLYDVNYLTGPEVYKAVCEGHTCSPKVFAPAPDRLLVNRGDGTFESLHPLTDETHGKGLGVVALPLQDRRRPSLFIANDQVPDYLLHSRPSGDRWNVRMEDEAFISGVAYNQDGLAMASMGIAADDVDGDGRVDLYVTAFKDEASMLFLQDAQGLFVDAANGAGLRGPTWPFVGWGTQFLDADLDGDPDLVGVNGHVDDYRDEGGEYHMRPQFFRNQGAGRFIELQADTLGPFFSEKRLGRGMARLDWNRDGRMDFAVSNIGDRASLVTNVTHPVGHYFNVRLHARMTARDAIGTVVELSAGERRWTRPLLAGDGYMASNERVVQFGLGAAESVDEVRVHWPSGNVTSARQLPADRTLQLVEAASQGLLWTTPDVLENVEVACESGR